jgi:hypothetical protein
MISLLLVISTYYRGKKVVLEIPMVEKHKKKAPSEKDHFDNKYFQFSSGLFSLYNPTHNNLFAEIFSLKNLANNKPYIFDITIDEYRYISCPIFLDPNKYMSSKKTYNEETEDDTEEKQNGTNLINIEENMGAVRLKMFNIVLVFEKNHKFLFKYLDNIYKILECFCNK